MAHQQYKQAAELVSDLTGVPVSHHHGHNTLNQATQITNLETVILDREEIVRKIKQAKSTPENKPVLVVALNVRLKSSGARWLVENGNGMLRLCCAMVNGSFDQGFAKYRTKSCKYLRTNV